MSPVGSGQTALRKCGYVLFRFRPRWGNGEWEGGLIMKFDEQVLSKHVKVSKTQEIAMWIVVVALVGR